MATEEQIVLALSPENGGTRVFNNVSHFEAWLSAQDSVFVGWYNAIQQTPESPRNQSYRADAPQLLKRARQPFRDALTNLSEKPIVPTHIANAVASIQSFDRRENLVTSDSARYQFLARLRETQPQAAFYALRHFMHAQNNTALSSDLFRGAFEAIMYELNLDNRQSEPLETTVAQLLTTVRQQIAQLDRQASDSKTAQIAAEQNFVAVLDAFRKKQQEADTSTQTLLAKLQTDADNTLASISTEATRVATELADAATEKRKQVESELLAFQNIITNKTVLKAPVEYWTAKATQHRNRSGNWFACGVASTLVGVGLVYLALRFTWTADFKAEFAEELWMQVILHLGPTALASFLGVWALRLCVRTFLSERHLANDADLRATMVSTYLAMRERTNTDPSDLGMRVALEALFRPVQAGLIPDELMPESPFHVLQGGLGSKSER